MYEVLGLEEITMKIYGNILEKIAIYIIPPLVVGLAIAAVKHAFGVTSYSDIVTWAVDNALLSISIILILILISFLVSKWLFISRLRKYFYAHKPHNFDIKLAEKYFFMPVANETFYSRRVIDDRIAAIIDIGFQNERILLIGPSGIGKSRLAHNIAKNGLSGRKPDLVLIPKTIDDLSNAINKWFPTLPDRSVLILDDIDKYSEIEGLASFIIKNNKRCICIGTIRSERLPYFKASKGLTDETGSEISKLFVEIEIPKLGQDEAIEAAELMGNEAKGYSKGDVPPDTFAWLVKDLSHEMRDFKNYLDLGKPEGYVLETLALAMFSGYMYPPKKTELPGLLKLLYPDLTGLDEVVFSGVEGLKTTKRISVFDHFVLCRPEYLAEVYESSIEPNFDTDIYIEAALLRSKQDNGYTEILNLVRNSFGFGNERLANKAARYAVREFEDEPNVYFEIGNIIREFAPKEAKQFYEKAISINDRDAGYYNNYALALTMLNEYEEAELNYRRALKIDNKDHQIFNNYGTLLAEIKEPEKAESNYNRAIELNPLYHTAYFNLGNLYLHQGRFKEALPLYEESIEISPLFFSGYANYAYVLSKIGENEKSIEQYEVALKLAPTSAKIRNNFGIVLQDSAKYKEATGQYLTAIKIDPLYVEPIVNLARLLDLIGRYRESEEYFKIGLKVAPNQSLQNRAYGFYLLGKKHYEEAERELSKSLALEPDNPDALGGYAEVLINLDRCDEAAEYIDDFIRIAPNHKNIDYINGVFQEHCEDNG